MKRSHSETRANLSTLPTIQNDAAFKSSLDGRLRLKVVKFVDISKPLDKPIEEIDEPEEDDTVWQNKMNKSNARMIMIDLKDSVGADIKALEAERIELLNNLKQGSIITLAGPVDVRCRNIMLEKKHVIEVEDGPKEEEEVREQPAKETKLVKPVVQLEDWDEDEEDYCVILD